jgi:hypothetical protein
MNWGKGITIFILAFIGFIGSMVYYAFTKNADLVREDYYEHETFYEQEKINRGNYLDTGEPVTIGLHTDAVLFHFPAAVAQQTDGKIVFYRPDQKKLDREFSLHVNEQHEQVLDRNHFEPGYYDVRVEWSDGSRSYLFEDHITFP